MTHLNDSCPVLTIEGKEYPWDSLSFEQVRCYFETGRGTQSGTGKNRILGYRKGCMTPIGDIEQSEWMKIVHFLIEREGEARLFHTLLAWVNTHCVWLRSKQEQELYALRLHADRFFSDPQKEGMNDAPEE
jgi:hypothetical protein